MKKKYIYLIFIPMFFVVSCFDKEEDVLNPGDDRGAQIPVISNIDPGVFDSNDLENTFVEFDVDVENGDAIENAAIQISYNSGFQRVEFSEIASFPSNQRIQLSDVVDKLGMSLNDVKLGDVFTIEIVTTSNDKTTRSTALINAAVVCAYDESFVTGSYHSVSPDWQSQGNITLTFDPNDPFIVYVKGLASIEGANENGAPLKMIVNPVDYSVRAEKTVIATDAFGYHDLAYAGSGLLNTCNGTYNMLFAITVAEGSFGTFGFTFTKN